MSLVEFWKSNPEAVLKLQMNQIVTLAGDGSLTDNSVSCNELRHYLSVIPEEKLFEHVRFCLETKFEKGPFALQDIINELGRRLDYDVANGLYQGRSGQIGFDGIWKDPDGHSIVVEIKTTTAFPISLDIIAGYRSKLISEGKITSESSMLIVVGRDNTNDLEAQIRGSRQGWDTRIISMEALMKLVALKVKSDEEITTEKIRSLLIPFEYTRLDNIIDVIFTTANDVETAAESEEESVDEKEIANDYAQIRTPAAKLNHIRVKSLNALTKREGVSLIAHRKTQFWSGDKNVRVISSVSKLYPSGHYWYSFHPYQKEFLSGGEKNFLLLGCMDSLVTYAIPYKKLIDILPDMDMTEKPDRKYWHLKLQGENGKYALLLPRKNSKLDLAPYTLSLA